jgi:hypothetical protein
MQLRGVIEITWEFDSASQRNSQESRGEVKRRDHFQPRFQHSEVWFSGRKKEIIEKLLKIQLKTVKNRRKSRKICENVHQNEDNQLETIKASDNGSKKSQTLSTFAPTKVQNFTFYTFFTHFSLSKVHFLIP